MNDNMERNSTDKKVCCICGREFTGPGHNPERIKEKGICCDACNKEIIRQVIIECMENAWDEEDT